MVRAATRPQAEAIDKQQPMNYYNCCIILRSIVTETSCIRQHPGHSEEILVDSFWMLDLNLDIVMDLGYV